MFTYQSTDPPCQARDGPQNALKTLLLMSVFTHNRFQKKHCNIGWKSLWLHKRKNTIVYSLPTTIFSRGFFSIFSRSQIHVSRSVHDEKRKKIINMASALVSYHVGMTDLWLRSLLADRGLSVPLVPWQWPSCLTMASSGMLLSPAPPFSCTLVNIFRLNVLKRRKKW